MNDPWKPCIEAARAAGETVAWVPDYGNSGAAWQRVEVTPAEIGNEPPATAEQWLTPSAEDRYPYGFEPSDLGRFEPSPYDLGLTDEPDLSWLLFNGQPVMEGAGGRLVYDCQPETADGCLIPVPEPEAGQ